MYFFMNMLGTQVRLNVMRIYIVAADNRNLSITRDDGRKMNSLMFDINSTTTTPMCAPVKS